MRTGRRCRAGCERFGDGGQVGQAIVEVAHGPFEWRGEVGKPDGIWLPSPYLERQPTKPEDERKKC